MTQSEYIALQIANIDKALVTGKRLLEVSVRLHRTCDSADKSENRNDSKRNYLQDSLMYYDFNAAVTEISGMPDILKEFKNQLIDIKIANDKMLLEGGYRKDIDEEISRVFLSHTLCKIQIIDEKVLATVKDAIATLEKLKETLKAL